MESWPAAILRLMPVLAFISLGLRRAGAPWVAFGTDSDPYGLFFGVIHEDPVCHFHDGATAPAADVVK